MDSSVAGPVQASENPETRMEYTGTAGELFPIVMINLILTIVTLGIFRFWARTKVRKYLWGETKLLGDQFEYTGNGKELFIGFLIVVVTVFIPMGFAFFKAQTALMQGDETTFKLWFGGIYVVMLYLMSVAAYRATRYRMSRTKWRGIRGGQDEKGWKYGGLSFLYIVLTIVTFGFAMPYMSAKLWNYEYNRKYFGNQKFNANFNWKTIFKSYVIALISVVLISVGMIFVAVLVMAGAASQPPSAITGLLVFALTFGSMAAIALVFSHFMSDYFKEASRSTTFGDLRFQFYVSPKGLFKFQLMNMVILMFTFGLGANFVEQRRVRFFAENLVIIGDLEGMMVGQSELEQDGYGEGLADAFDMGGI